jgi:predicted RNA-binding protein with PIN domain
MSATYLIDGYNLLHAMGALGGPVGPGGLAKARLRLLGLLHGTLTDQASSATVVFDASGAACGAAGEVNFHGVHVVFAIGKKDADDVIEQFIRAASAPKSLHVVSDDHRIQQAAKRRQCVVMGCEEFLLWLDQYRRQQQAQAALAPEKQDKLSEEELQRWLAEFVDLEKDPSLRQAFEKYDFEDHEAGDA